MSYRRTTQSLTDQERLTQLKGRAWGQVARNLLKGSKDPSVISSRKIESNASRVNKAIRDLGDYVSYSRTKQEYSQSHKYYRVAGYNEESQEYGVAPTYDASWSAFHKMIFRGYANSNRTGSQEDFDYIGYMNVDNLCNSAMVYVYWHQDEYDIIKIDDSVYVYPVALKETRIKNMLRAIVEQHYRDDYTNKIERYLDLEPGTLKHEYDNSSINHFGEHAEDFTVERFFGTNGYRDEYKHGAEYYAALLHKLNKIAALIESKGGYEAITREMRRASMEELLINAPLVIHYEQEENKHFYTVKQKYHNKYMNIFMLRHSAHFVYDTLYGDDESVTPTDENRKDTWEPDEKRTKFIEAYRKDIACSQKNTCAVCQPT